MNVERTRPRAHLVVDDFFSPAALAAIFRELPSLHRKMRPGLVRDLGHDGQSVFFAHPRRKNEAVWIHDPSRTLRLFREQFWSDAMQSVFAGAREPLFQIIPSCAAPHLQVSRYMTGDHYDFHEDEGAGVNLTALVFLAAEPSKVRGGDLVLAFDGEEARIRFRHNRLVVFPSKTLHRVTRVRVDSEDPSHARISLQCWLTYGGPEERPKARRPEADRPTFLLAEAPILAAAQAMVASEQSRDQTPEELYWGAFYVSRILSQNLRCILAERAAGDVRIRREDGLEVYVRCKVGAARGRVGFRLRGPEVDVGEALSFFVEAGAGRTAARREVRVPLGAGERDTVAIVTRLLGRG